jgi:anti-sigma-K factor RskA
MTHEEFESIAALDAVGAATREERESLAAHLESCQDCRRVRDEYAEAATLLARGLEPVAPPADIRERVVATMDDEDEDEVDDGRRFMNPWWLATAATLFLALWGWREFGIRVNRETIRSQEAEIQQLKEEKRLLAQDKEKLMSQMSSIAAPETRTIALTGQQVSPSASARVFLEPQARRAVVFFRNLPANPGDKSYQLWIIRADQSKPQSAGVFEVGQSGSANLVIENLPVGTEMKALAVTLEPRGGVEQPTNTNFYLMGNS